MTDTVANLAGAFCRRLLWLWLAWAAIGVSRAQPAADSEYGVISGQVSDSWNGRGVAGVVVTLRGTTLGATTDAQGNFTLRQVPPGSHNLTFSKNGYLRGSANEVRVIAGQASKADAQLKPEFFEMETFEVVAEPFVEQKIEILDTRLRSVISMDAIGSEQFSKAGVSDAADILTKITGATVVDGKTAVIRGLSDRYTSTTLNSAAIPSADPKRKSVQLDLFPSSMIDRVVVNKVFTPDQPGGFTGGSINIVTKSFPEKFTFSASAGMSYNSQATGNEHFLTYPGGNLDWLAMDDGTRALPDGLGGDVNNPNYVLPQHVAFGGTTASRMAANARLEALTRAFSPTMGPIQEAAPWNSSYSISVGDTVTNKLFNQPFGYFAAVSYARNFNFYENGIRVSRAASGAALVPTKQMTDSKAVEEATWATVANLAFKLHEDHQLDFNFLYNQASEDIARRQKGTDNSLNPEDTLYRQDLQFTERFLNTYQIKGKHEFAALSGLKLDWLFSLASTGQEEPDQRIFNYIGSPDGLGGNVITLHSALVPSPNSPTRIYRRVEEDNFNFKLDLAKSVPVWSGLEAEIKLGMNTSPSKRSYAERTFSYERQGFFYNYAGDPENFPNDFLSPANLGYNADGTLRHYLVSELGNNFYEGRQKIDAGYVMGELPITDSLKITGGLRHEKTSLSLKILPGGGLSTDINRTDLLPAISLLYQITSNMNFRLGYGSTIARPTFREIAPIRLYDAAEDEILEGNSTLKLSSIKNYDARWEWFPNPGEVISMSLFYKDLANPIERYSINLSSDILTFTNRAEAQVYGFEFELRKSLEFIEPNLKPFTFGVNFSYIESKTALTTIELINKGANASPSRPLYDQSPYILNADLSYDNKRTGTAVSLVYNYTAPRVYLSQVEGPDIYEHPAESLDLIISQKLWRKLKLRLTAKNLLDPLTRRTYGAEPGAPVYSANRKGRTFGLSLSAEY